MGKNEIDNKLYIHVIINSKQIYMAEPLINSPLLVDILTIFINKSVNTVCKYWYNLWLEKPICMNLKNNNNVDISKFKNIIEFSLGKNTIIEPYLDKLPKLKIFNIDENIYVTNDILKNLTNLTSLSLNNNTIIEDESLRKLTNLKKLKIINANITYDSLKNLCIKNLSIGNNILNADLQKMKEITKIKMFHRNQPDDILHTLICLPKLMSVNAVQCTLPIGTRLEQLHYSRLGELNINRHPNLKVIKEECNKYV